MAATPVPMIGIKRAVIKFFAHPTVDIQMNGRISVLAASLAVDHPAGFMHPVENAYYILQAYAQISGLEHPMVGAEMLKFQEDVDPDGSNLHVVDPEKFQFDKDEQELDPLL